MFELEDYSSGFHDGFLNKYTESGGPTLDLYMSDSLQDMLHVDIRSEIANVVGGHTELDAMVNDLPTSLDHALEAISSINNNTSHHSLSSSHHQHSLHTSSTSTWMGTTNSSSWSSSNDFYADVGACVNPISVMPLISSSLLHQSPKTNLNANSLQHRTTSPPPSSPNVNDTKSHLTFSPAQIKLSAGAIRNEQILSHIPKQIVAISSTVTAGTTAPATLATNSALQRKGTVAALDAVKKDLGADLRKVTSTGGDDNKSSGNGLLSSANGTNTIKLAPGIGGLTFANSITYNKLRQQTSAKSPQGSPITANGTIVLKRDRDASPLHHMATLNASNGQKVLPRNIVQTTNSFTPKSIASAAHSPHHNFNNVNAANSMGSSSTASSTAASAQSSGGASTYSSSNGAFTAGLTPITLHANGGGNSISNGVTSIAVKSLQQKIKPAPVEPEFPKPAYSYSCLIALALKNSRSGSLPVSEIYSFMCEHFPYFKTAPSGWKNSVRHNLSLNKCFEKIEKPATNGSQRKGCLWAMNPDRITKMDEEVQKWSRKDPMAIRNAMVFPEHLESLERGEMKHGSSGDSDVELDSQSEIEETSDLEEQDVDETIVDNMFVEEDIEEDELLSSDCGNGVHGLSDNGSMLSNNIVVINGAGRSSGGNEGYTRIQQSHSSSSSSSTSSGIVCSGDELSMSEIAQKQRDFDIEVEDIYDAIDFEDENKEAVRMAINSSDIIELSPSDLNVQTNGYQSPKRARLNINYSIGPAGELEKQLQQQNIKKIKLQPVSLQQMQQQQLQQQLQQQQQQQHQQQQHHHHHHQQQHIVVQTISNVTTATLQGTPVTMATATPAQLQQITALAQQQRRKIQLVNRIA